MQKKRGQEKKRCRNKQQMDIEGKIIRKERKKTFLHKFLSSENLDY